MTETDLPEPAVSPDANPPKARRPRSGKKPRPGEETSAPDEAGAAVVSTCFQAVFTASEASGSAPDAPRPWRKWKLSFTTGTDGVMRTATTFSHRLGALCDALEPGDGIVLETRPNEGKRGHWGDRLVHLERQGDPAPDAASAEPDTSPVI